MTALADRIAPLGIESGLADGDLVEAAVVLVKVVDPEGKVRLRIAWSDGLSWIERRGMIEIARDADIADEPTVDP